MMTANRTTMGLPGLLFCLRRRLLRLLRSPRLRQDNAHDYKKKEESATTTRAVITTTATAVPATTWTWMWPLIVDIVATIFSVSICTTFAVSSTASTNRNTRPSHCYVVCSRIWSPSCAALRHLQVLFSLSGNA